MSGYGIIKSLKKVSAALSTHCHAHRESVLLLHLAEHILYLLRVGEELLLSAVVKPYLDYVARATKLRLHSIDLVKHHE